MALMDNEAKLQLKTCTTADNSVTHMNGNDVATVSFMWMPPMGDMGNIKIMLAADESAIPGAATSQIITQC